MEKKSLSRKSLFAENLAKNIRTGFAWKPERQEEGPENAQFEAVRTCWFDIPSVFSEKTYSSELDLRKKMTIAREESKRQEERWCKFGAKIAGPKQGERASSHSNLMDKHTKLARKEKNG